MAEEGDESVKNEICVLQILRETARKNRQKERKRALVWYNRMFLVICSSLFFFLSFFILSCSISSFYFCENMKEGFYFLFSLKLFHLLHILWLCYIGCFLLWCASRVGGEKREVSAKRKSPLKFQPRIRYLSTCALDKLPYRLHPLTL